MSELPIVDWAALSHAYGSAENIPALLAQAETDTRGGHVPGSTWFALWSALCHQGDTYSASIAAVPFLVRLAELPEYHSRHDPLLLAASIEVSHIEGHGPEGFPEGIVVAYRAALLRGRELAQQALEGPLDSDSYQAYRGCIAVFFGQIQTAHIIWDDESESAV